MINIKIGKTYDYFDDGKINPARRLPVKIKSIIPFDEIDNKTIKQWMLEVQEHPLIYNNTTDYFIAGDLHLESDIEKVVFVRTKDNDWFSLGYWGGYLDHDGQFLKQMNEYYPEEK